MTDAETTIDPRCFAVRRLNPFLGVVEAVETPNARALSVDGATWQLQILAERPEHTWGSLNQRAAVKQFFGFGVWHPDNGVSRVPVNPVLDVGAMLAAAQTLVSAIPAVLGQLPFPLADRHELWLLDRDRQPLALLASTTEARFIEVIEPQAWQATLPAGTPFVSSALTDQGISVRAHGSRRFHAQILEKQVRDQAAAPPAMQWYLRDAGGAGRPLSDAQLPTTAEALDAAVFPVAGVRTEWQDEAQHRLMEDYLDWLAPRLLTLPALPHTLRERLEQAARSQAELVDATYRLYPKIVNPAVIDAVRVEAKLRTAAAAV